MNTKPKDPLLLFPSIPTQSTEMKHQPLHSPVTPLRSVPEKKKAGKEIGKEEQVSAEMTEKLNQLAEILLKHWPIHVEKIELIQGGQMALVWKLTTAKGPLCLKRIHRPEKKSLFSINAQDYLAKKGAHVPGILPNKDGFLYTKQGPFLYVVYDWVIGTVFDDQLADDLTWMMKGLADYHKNSIGYQPPEGTTLFSKLGKWPRHYRKRCQQMTAWKLIAKEEAGEAFADLYLNKIDDFIAFGEQLIEELNHSYYPEWVKKCEKSPSLCHQDYGTGNTLLSGTGKDEDIWLIDLDTTTFDLPIRDLRKIIIPLMNDRGQWDSDYFNLMLRAYESYHPLTKAEEKVLFIDMLFPYELYSVVQDKYGRKNDVPVEELTTIFDFEQMKREQISKRLKNL